MIKKCINGSLHSVGFEIVSLTRTGVDPLRDVARVLHGTTRAVHTVFDVGANNGQTALEILRSLQPVRLFCFEPFRETYAMLLKTIGRKATVQCKNVGFSDVTESVRCRVSENSEMNSASASLNADVEVGPSEVINLTTVDKFCSDNRISRISLLKTDTEGLDLRVLRGATELLTNSAIDCVVAEVGFYVGDVRHTPFVELHQFLGQFGYRLFSLCSQHLSQDGKFLEYGNAVFVSSELC